jgi:hypothetical protein
MAQKTYTIELKVNFTDDGKHDAMREALRDAARTILTSAMMLADRGKPQVALHSSDFFYGNEDFSLEDTDDRK